MTLHSINGASWVIYFTLKIKALSDKNNSVIDKYREGGEVMKKSLAAAMLLSAVTLEFFTITDSVKAFTESVIVKNSRVTADNNIAAAKLFFITSPPSLYLSITLLFLSESALIFKVK